jgi:hypothetical protein
MHGICKPFQVNFHVLPFKKPSKHFSFCDTVFSSWEHSGRIFYLPYCLFQKEKKGKRKEKKKGTPPLSMDFVSQEHGVPRDEPKDSNAGG